MQVGSTEATCSEARPRLKVVRHVGGFVTADGRHDQDTSYRISRARKMVGMIARRRFFPKKRISKEQSTRLRAWKRGSPIPMPPPPPKRVRRFDSVPLRLCRRFARFVVRIWVRFRHCILIICPVTRLGVPG